MGKRKKRRRRNNDPGFVYAIAVEGEWGTYKVGRAKDVKKRLASLQIGSAKKLTVLRQFYAPNARRAENAMHALLASFHVRGEWYKCKIAAVDTAWSAYKSAGYKVTQLDVDAWASAIADGLVVGWKPSDAERPRKRKFDGRKPVGERGPLLPGVGVVRSASAPDRR